MIVGENFQNPFGPSVIEKVAASLQRGLETVGGTLTLKSELFYFKPHPINFQSKSLELRMSDIVMVESTKTFGLIPNRFRVTLKSGKHQSLIVFKRDEIVAYIQKNIRS